MVRISNRFMVLRLKRGFMRKNILFVSLLLIVSNMFSRTVDFNYMNHNYVEYIINEEIRIRNKTDYDIELAILACKDGDNVNELSEITRAQIKSKGKISLVPNFDDASVQKGFFQLIRINTSNNNVTFKVKSNRSYLEIVIQNLPTYSQVSEYRRSRKLRRDEIEVKVAEDIYHRLPCLIQTSQKNYDSEVFIRYIVVNEYFLGSGEKGSREYIEYTYKPVCMPYYTEEHKQAVQEFGNRMYELSEEQKKRIKENIELNPDDVTYLARDYPRTTVFCASHIVGQKYIVDKLNYFNITSMNTYHHYYVWNEYTRAVFHCPHGLGGISQVYNKRVITYLGKTEVVRSDGVVVSERYYECSPRLENFSEKLLGIIKENGNWDNEIILTGEVWDILKK